MSMSCVSGGSLHFRPNAKVCHSHRRIRPQLQLRFIATKCMAEEEPEAEGSKITEKCVRVEVSTSVMDILEGKVKENERKPSLIEMNEKKRKKLSQESASSKNEAESNTVAIAKDDLFGKLDIIVPQHDSLFPLMVALFTALNDEREPDEQLSEKFSSISRLPGIVEEDLIRMQELSLAASGLFCDINGEPLNAEGDMRFERWFLLSMYVKLKLWWKGPSAAADIALEYVYKISSFIFDGDDQLPLAFEGSEFTPERRLAMRYGSLFVGKCTGKPSSSLKQIQSRLDKNNSGLAALLVKAGEEIACLVTHRTSLIFLNIPHDKVQPLYGVLLACVGIWNTDFVAADANAGLVRTSFVWERYLIPLGLLAVIGSGGIVRKGIASLYKVSEKMMTPLLPLPVAQQGAFPMFVYYKGCLPNRSCLFDISAAASITSLSMSALLLLSPYASSTTDLHGCFLIPSNTFAYSTSLSWLMNKLSVTSLMQGDEMVMVMNPVVLAGLLGLNFTFFTLVPSPLSDGGRMITAVFGRKSVELITAITCVLVPLCLVSKSLWVGVLWMLTYALMPSDSFQRDEVSEPNIWRKATAILLTSTALLSLIPAF